MCVAFLPSLSMDEEKQCTAKCWLDKTTSTLSYISLSAVTMQKPGALLKQFVWVQLAQTLYKQNKFPATHKWPFPGTLLKRTTHLKFKLNIRLTSLVCFPYV